MDIIFEKQFVKDTQVCKNRGYNMDLLKKAIVILQRKGILPASYKTHILKGTKYKNKNIIDSHLDDDWVIAPDSIRGNICPLLLKEKKEGKLKKTEQICYFRFFSHSNSSITSFSTSDQ